MLITKIFNGEMSHVVRNCTSQRCSHSIHGHSFKLEVSLASDHLDNAGMILDFGLLKNSIKQFIDAFDHCHVLWNKDKESYRNFIKRENDRWIELSVNPSAEWFSLFFLYWINRILGATKFNNGEGTVYVYSVKYHETATGSATAFSADLETVLESSGEGNFNFVASKGAIADWDDTLTSFVFDEPMSRKEIYFNNPKVKKQVQ